MRANGVYQSVRDTILTEMRKLSREEARQLAHNITQAINDWLLGKISLNQYAPMVDALVPETVRSELLLTVAWNAFGLAYPVESPSIGPDEVIPICTMPLAYRSMTAFYSFGVRTGFGGVSIRGSIQRLINEAKSELIFMAPYWSQAGVDMLCNLVIRKSLENLDVTIMTQPRMRHAREQADAIEGFALFLIEKGATVEILAPSMNGHSFPLMHAKSLIVDGKIAYVGSANYSQSGMDESFELGVCITGTSAQKIAQWAKLTHGAFVPWDAEGLVSYPS